MKTAPKQLTKSEAWALIAREFERTRRREIASAGLCNAISTLHHSQKISVDTYQAMEGEISHAKHEQRTGSAWLFGYEFLDGTIAHFDKLTQTQLRVILAQSLAEYDA